VGWCALQVTNVPSCQSEITRGTKQKQNQHQHAQAGARGNPDGGRWKKKRILKEKVGRDPGEQAVFGEDESGKKAWSRKKKGGGNGT